MFDGMVDSVETAPIKIRLIGDHSAEHCGCAAVTQVLTDAIQGIGVQVGSSSDFDILLVNGEGSMHHGSVNFLKKMSEIRRAQDTGKIALLVNTVWQDNPSSYDDCLNKLELIEVRGAASLRDLRDRHGIIAQNKIDLSYHAPLAEFDDFVDFDEKVAVTDFFTSEISFAWPSGARYAQWERVSMRDFSWSGLVASLKTASVVVTGRHHAMYAACRARVPFVPFAGNSHKFEDLLESAKIPIPIARNIEEARSLIPWVKSNRALYNDLFSWMDAQPRWHLDVNGAKDQDNMIPSIETPSLVQQARSASTRQDYAAAALLWSELMNAGPLSQPDLRLAARSFLSIGQMSLGMRLVTDGRWKQKGAMWFLVLLAQIADQANIWLSREDVDGWWMHLREGVYRASIGQIDACREEVRQALSLLKEEGGAVLISGVLYFLACKLIALGEHRIAYDLREEYVVKTTPVWAKTQEDVLLLNLWRRFDDEADNVVRRAQLAPCWADMSCRGAIYRYRWLREGASASLIADLRQAHSERPANRVFRDLLYATAGEAGLLREALGPIENEQHRWRLEEDAARSLPLAQYLASHGLARKMLSHRLRLMFDAMQRETARFLSILADPAQSVAVVGNSPVEIGQGRGAAIDAHRHVIRFNDYSVAPPHDVDYGARTDFAVRTVIDDETLKQDSYLPDTVVLLRHVVFRERKDWDHILDLYEGGMRFGYLPWSCYRAAAMRARATPSVGLIVATALAERRGALSRDDFFGFSFLDQLKGERRAHYFNAERPSMIHDWEREAVIFDSFFG